MCWACNPYCGRCRPPKRRSVECPNCGELLTFDKQQSLDGDVHVCYACDADVTALAHVQPLFCKKDGNWCAYPCGSHDTASDEADFACKHRTPVEGGKKE